MMMRVISLTASLLAVSNAFSTSAQDNPHTWRDCGTMFEHSHGQGTSLTHEVKKICDNPVQWAGGLWCLTHGNYGPSSYLHSWNDIISSVQVHTGCYMALYQHTPPENSALYYTGQTSSWVNLSGWKNDQVSEYKCWCPYEGSRRIETAAGADRATTAVTGLDRILPPPMDSPASMGKDEGRARDSRDAASATVRTDGASSQKQPKQLNSRGRAPQQPPQRTQQQMREQALARRRRR